MHQDHISKSRRVWPNHVPLLTTSQLAIGTCVVSGRHFTAYGYPSSDDKGHSMDHKLTVGVYSFYIKTFLNDTLWCVRYALIMWSRQSSQVSGCFHWERLFCNPVFPTIYETSKLNLQTNIPKMPWFTNRRHFQDVLANCEVTTYGSISHMRSSYGRAH